MEGNHKFVSPPLFGLNRVFVPSYSGASFAWVSWILRNPWNFEKHEMEPTDFKGKERFKAPDYLAILVMIKVWNPRIVIPNYDLAIQGPR